jgi:hypothetical protein
MTTSRAGLLTKTVCLALVSVTMVFGTACGNREERTSGDEGELVHVGDVVYQVQLTRLLNPHQRPDDSYIRGQPTLPADEQYLAVFLRIENEGKESYSPPRDMRVVDTEGNQYLPLDASQTGFGLDFGEAIPPGKSAPPPNSPAAQGPASASLLLFRVKVQSATENLPVKLEVPAGANKISRIRLDV